VRLILDAALGSLSMGGGDERGAIVPVHHLDKNMDDAPCVAAVV
jgi:hypothetical protein